MSGGHDDRGAEGAGIEAPKTPSRVGYGEGCPLPSQSGGLRERHELPQWGPGHRTLLVARKIRFCCQKYKKKLVLQYCKT